MSKREWTYDRMEDSGGWYVVAEGVRCGTVARLPSKDWEANFIDRDDRRSGFGTRDEAAHFLWVNTGHLDDAPAKSSALTPRAALASFVKANTRDFEEEAEVLEFLASLESEVRADERAKEREACAGECEAVYRKWDASQRFAENKDDAEAANRCSTRKAVAQDCADAIRNRK